MAARLAGMNAGTTDIDQDEAADGGTLIAREIARLAFAVNDSYYDLLRPR